MLYNQNEFNFKSVNFANMLIYQILLVILNIFGALFYSDYKNMADTDS